MWWNSTLTFNSPCIEIIRMHHLSKQYHHYSPVSKMKNQKTFLLSIDLEVIIQPFCSYIDVMVKSSEIICLKEFVNKTQYWSWQPCKSKIVFYSKQQNITLCIVTSGENVTIFQAKPSHWFNHLEFLFECQIPNGMLRKENCCLVLS